MSQRRQFQTEKQVSLFLEMVDALFTRNRMHYLSLCVCVYVSVYRPLFPLTLSPSGFVCPPLSLFE